MTRPGLAAVNPSRRRGTRPYQPINNTTKGRKKTTAPLICVPVEKPA
jgi:hypothetical protein